MAVYIHSCDLIPHHFFSDLNLPYYFNSQNPRPQSWDFAEMARKVKTKHYRASATPGFDKNSSENSQKLSGIEEIFVRTGN
jgi:hypothetical protein